MDMLIYIESAEQEGMFIPDITPPCLTIHSPIGILRIRFKAHFVCGFAVSPGAWTYTAPVVHVFFTAGLKIRM